MGTAGVTWDLVYDLAADAAWVQLINDTSPNYATVAGVRALFGSAEWWDAVASGAIETREISGTISSVYWSGHGDYAQFEVTADDDSTSVWERRGDVTRYVAGLHARLQYAVLSDIEQLLRVWIERSTERNLDMGRSQWRSDRCARCGRLINQSSSTWTPTAPGELCSWCFTNHGPEWLGEPVGRVGQWLMRSKLTRWLFPDNCPPPAGE
jgi:hypothetical protein